MAKIYTKGNYFFIEKDGRRYDGLRKDVKVYKNTSDETTYFFEKLEKWKNNGLNIQDIKKENGDAYTQEEWETFYLENTGSFSNGGGNGEGLQAYDVSEEYKEDAVIIKDDKIYIANDLIPANTPFAIGTTGATWREISEGSNFWEATSTDSTTAYIYKGGLNGTNWQINRYDRADNLAKTSATVSNNSGITTLATAWADRLTINYV